MKEFYVLKKELEFIELNFGTSISEQPTEL